MKFKNTMTPLRMFLQKIDLFEEQQTSPKADKDCHRFTYFQHHCNGQ